MNRTLFFSLICSICLGFMMTSCKGDDEGDEGHMEISHYDEDESHNHGMNCMQCHVQGGEAGDEGWFSVAGSVYDSTMTEPYPGATIRLYTEPDGGGELKATIAVDALGNFYTTENIDFGDTGLYPSLEGHSGEIEYMDIPAPKGACNSCHGMTTDKLWVE